MTGQSDFAIISCRATKSPIPGHPDKCSTRFCWHVVRRFRFQAIGVGEPLLRRRFLFSTLCLAPRLFLAAMGNTKNAKHSIDNAFEGPYLLLYPGQLPSGQGVLLSIIKWPCIQLTRTIRRSQIARRCWQRKPLSPSATPIWCHSRASSAAWSRRGSGSGNVRWSTVHSPLVGAGVMC